MDPRVEAYLSRTVELAQQSPVSHSGLHRGFGSAARLFHKALREVSLTDVSGTEYQFVGGGSHGGASSLTGDSRFAPGAPSTVSTLTFGFATVEFQIPLDHPG
jgi:hypothetical protein